MIVDDPHRRRVLVDALNEAKGHRGHVGVDVRSDGDRVIVDMTVREFDVLEELLGVAVDHLDELDPDTEEETL